MKKECRNQIFLSYAHENFDCVEKIYKGLKKRKLTVWLDKADLKPGKYKLQIRKAIARSNYFVICISEAALRKVGDEKPGFQDEELNMAYEIAMAQPDNEFSIVPVRIEDCHRGDARLSSYQQYDLFNDFEKDLDRLAVDLGGKSLSDAQAKDYRSEDDKIIACLMSKALAHFYSGNFEKALTNFNTITTLNPDDVTIWNNKGVALGMLNRNEEALAAFEKAIELNPNYAKARYNKGTVIDVRHNKLIRHEEPMENMMNNLMSDMWKMKDMNLTKIGLQFLDFQKSAFDKTYNAMMQIQQQTEKMAEPLFKNNPVIPEELKSVFKKNQDGLKNAIDDGFIKTQSYFSDVSNPTKK